MIGTWIGADAPAARHGGVAWGAWALLAGSLLGATAVGWAIVGRVAETNLVMLYLLAVVAVALRGDWRAAVGAAVASVLTFDFFFVPPFLAFTVSDAEYLFTFLVMGIVAGLVSALVARLAAELATARGRERQAQALYELSRSLLAVGAPRALLAEGARVIGAELGQGVSAWLLDADGRPEPASSPPPALDASETELIRWVLREGRPAGPGTDVLPGGSLFLVPVAGPRSVLGALGVRVAPKERPDAPEVRAALETGANVLAIALEQARASEEAAAQRARADAEHLRGALLSAVSHDLRTPLTGIVGAASAIAEAGGAMPENVRHELASGIVEEAERLGRLVTNLLQASRLEAGPAALHREWTDLEALVGSALGRLDAALAGREVSLDLAPDALLAFVDPVLAEQLLLNLLDNAAKHTPAGGALAVSLERAGAAVVLDVADRGPGLPAGREDRLFEKFQRFAGGAGAPGTGLGLAICRGIAQAHGGAITALNRPGGGAVFRVTLPADAPRGA